MNLPLLISIPVFLLLHYLLFLSGVLRGLNRLRPPSKRKDEYPAISVIIPFRNESASIVQNLKSIEAQSYPQDKIEVLYVDDASEDDSHEKLLEAITKPYVKVIRVPEGYSPDAHKKRAIRYGIENTSGEIIIGTDADTVHGEHWLETMADCFGENTAFVSGPVAFSGGEAFFSRLQRLEFEGLVLTGAGLIGAGSPTICNAANIAYRRDVYNEVNGFAGTMNLTSGDDELLMQKIAADTGYEIDFCYDSRAMVRTEPNETVNQFYQQRKRWASKGLFYRNKLLILRLALIYLFFLSLPLSVAAISLDLLFLHVSLALFAVKAVAEYAVLKKGDTLFGRSINGLVFTVAQLLHTPYIVVAGLVGALGDYVWKGRRVKR